MKPVTLGSRYRDIASGFQGIAIKRAEIFRELPEVLLQPVTDSDGAFKEPQWFGEGRLDLIEETRWGFLPPTVE